MLKQLKIRPWSIFTLDECKEIVKKNWLGEAIYFSDLNLLVHNHMSSNITELCQNFGIGLLLMYLETAWIKEPLYLIIFSRSFYRKEMEIIGESKFISFKKGSSVRKFSKFEVWKK